MVAMALPPILAENSLFKSVGQIFHPLFELVATVLAFIYGIVPTYAIAIILLTILIMALLTPLTIKSTKSMMAMQGLQPELQKLRQKYKGAENREQLNQEMMRLYREHGVSPTGGCLPMFLQMPALIVLYDTIRGLANTINKGTKFPTTAVLPLTLAKQDAIQQKQRANTPITWTQRTNGLGQTHAGHQLAYVGTHHGASFAALQCTPHAGTVCAVPRYIPTSSRMFHDLIQTPGVMKSWGLNLASKPLSHHANWWDYIPYLILVAIAVALQYFQMSQMTKRNKAAAQANPQMQTMQKVMPLIFAYIYFLIPVGVVLYMIVSSAIRILTQDLIFRHGIVQAPGEREIGASGKEKPIPASSAALDPGEPKPPKDGGGAGSGTSGKARQPGQAGSAKGAGASNGSRSGAKSGQSNGATTGTTDAKAHPRSKSKRARKAR